MLIDHQKIILSRTGGGLSLRAIAGFINVVFFWGVMLYLMRSLFLAVRGSFNSAIFGEDSHSFRGENIATPFFFYVSLILTASFSLWAWAHYNRRRYGGMRDKRTVHPPALTLVQLSNYTGFSIIKLLQMRHAKMLVAHFDAKRDLEEMDCHETIQEKPTPVEIDFPLPYDFEPEAVEETEAAEVTTEVEEVADVEVAYCRASRRLTLPSASSRTRRRPIILDVEAVEAS